MEGTGATTLRPPRPPLDPSGPEGRLAELVAHLTGCPPGLAVQAVGRALPDEAGELSVDARLAVVARAVVHVKKEHLDIRDRRVS